MVVKNPLITSLSDFSSRPNLSGDINPDDFEVEIEGQEEAAEPELEEEGELDHYQNLVPYINPLLLPKIANDVIEGYQQDLNSRSEWEQAIKDGLENLGLVLEILQEPFPGACSVQHPIILENAVEFQSKAASELLPANGPVKVQILGKQTPEKIEQSERVKQHMNYQITKVMTEFYPDSERMLFYLPLVGSAFKNSYYDYSQGRPVSEYIPIDQFVVSNSAQDLRRAYRYTQVLYVNPHDLKRNFEEGFWEEPPNFSKTPSDVPSGSIENKVNELLGHTVTEETKPAYKILEQHVDMTLPGRAGEDSDLAKPYIVTVDLDSSKVLAIRKNWRKGDRLTRKRIWFTHYCFVPGMGFYGLGYFHLLGNLQAGLTTMMRAFVDSAQFENLPGGFKRKGVKINNDNSPIGFGEWKEMELIGDMKLQDVIMPIQTNGPSSALFNAIQYLDERAQRFADTTKQVVSDSTNYGPVGTTMALLEASTKFFSAIHKRLHYAQEQELKQLGELNYEHLEDETTSYNVVGDTWEIQREDYNHATIDICPVSDPNITSSAQRLAIAQTKLNVAIQKPEIHNLKLAYRDFYHALGVDNVDDLLPPDEEAQPQDPMADIMAVIQGKPIGAFPGQNHQAHMQFKGAWLQDPTQGKSEIMQPFLPIVLSNVREHALLQFQTQVQGAMANLENRAASSPEQQEMVLAEAAQQVAQMNEFMSQQQQGGNPIQKIAEAAFMEAQAEVAEVQRKEREMLFKAGDSIQKNAIMAAKEMNRSEEAQSKIQQEQMRLGLETMQKGLDQVTKAKEHKLKEKQLGTNFVQESLRQSADMWKHKDTQANTRLNNQEKLGADRDKHRETLKSTRDGAREKMLFDRANNKDKQATDLEKEKVKGENNRKNQKNKKPNSSRNSKRRNNR